jgi:hypothetical protein
MGYATLKLSGINTHEGHTTFFDSFITMLLNCKLTLIKTAHKAFGLAELALNKTPPIISGEK